MRSSLDVDGFHRYLFSYRHDGQTWCFEVYAKSEEDAKARLARIQYATFDGEVVFVVSAYAGPLARFAVLLRNALMGFLRPTGG